MSTVKVLSKDSRATAMLFLLSNSPELLGLPQHASYVLQLLCITSQEKTADSLAVPSLGYLLRE